MGIRRLGIFTNIDILRYNSSHIFQLKQKDHNRKNKRIGDVVGGTEEKYGECEEEGLPVTDKSEEASDLKKYLKMFQNSPYLFFS